MDTSPADKNTPRQLRIARAMAVLIALVCIGLGLYVASTGQFHGYSSRRNVEVNLDGQRAMSMAYVLIALGALPLGLCFRTKKAALRWLLACAVAFAVALGMALRG